MKIFLDTSNAADIKQWTATGLVDGVTTNPSIMKKAGIKDVEGAVREIAGLIGDRPLSVEVTTNDPDDMVRQANVFTGWARNIVVKVPIETPEGRPCFDVIHHLERQEDIRVNCTAVLSFG